jgi:hypothetical protein
MAMSGKRGLQYKGDANQTEVGMSLVYSCRRLISPLWGRVAD